jgi:hypothetical protein
LPHVSQLLEDTQQATSPSPTPEAVPWNSYLIDLELTHFYLVHTCQSLWGRTEGHVIHRDTVFHEAMRQPALLNAIFTTAALHKVSLDRATNAEYIPVALHKQRQALEGLRLLLRSLDIESYKTIFALSILVSIWALASRRLPEELSILSTMDPIPTTGPEEMGGALHPITPATATATATATSDLDLFLQLIRRIRPVQAIALESRSWILNGDFSGLIRTPDPSQVPELPSGITEALEELEAQLQAQAPAIAAVFASLGPRYSLSHQFRLSRSPDWLELLLGWPMALPIDFVEALQGRDHAALTVLAYWAACFYSLDGRWWANGWAAALIAEADGIVEGVWSQLLQWPKLYLSVL